MSLQERLKCNFAPLPHIAPCNGTFLHINSKLSISANEYKDLVDVAQNGIRDKAELEYVNSISALI